MTPKSDKAAKAGSFQEHLRKMRKEDPGYAELLERGMAARVAWVRRTRATDNALYAAVRELAENCGLKLSKRKPVLPQIIERVESFTPRQVRGLFTVMRALPYLQDLNINSSSYPNDEYGDQLDDRCPDYSTPEVQELTREIRAGVEPPKRCAA